MKALPHAAAIFKKCRTQEKSDYLLCCTKYDHTMHFVALLYYYILILDTFFHTYLLPFI